MAANTWQPEDSYSSLYSDAGYGSGPAGGPRSPTLAGEAFKVMLKDVASQMSTEDVEKLTFFCGNSNGDSSKKSALELLWGLVKRGKFSSRCVDGLEKHLRHIDRCDLITEYLEPFVNKFPAREVGGAVGARQESLRAHQVSTTSEGDIISGSGIPATTLQSGHHGNHSLQHSQSQPPMTFHSSDPSSKFQRSHSSSIAARNASQSLVVGSTGNWVKGVIEAGHTSLEPAPPPTGTSVSSTDVVRGSSQSHTQISGKVQSSPMAGSELPSSMSSWQSTSGTSQPGKGGHSKVLLSSPGRPMFQPRPLHTRPTSTDPSLSSLCRVQEEEVLGNMDFETVSVSSGLHLNALPYAAMTEGNSNMHRRLSSSHAPHTQEQQSVGSGSHFLEESVFERPVEFSSDDISGGTASSVMFSPAHGAVGARGDEQHPVTHATGSHIGGRVTEGQGVERATGGVPRPENRFSASLPVRRDEEREIANRRLTDTTSSQQPSNLPKSGQTYREDHVIILSSSDMVKFIGDKVGRVQEEFSVRVNVNCRCSRHKEVRMKLIPHKEQHHQYVSLDACLHISKRCSRHKWLVQFTDSHLQVCTYVTQNGREVCAASETTPIIPMDDPSGDNLTQLCIANVMSHEHVLYKAVAQYRLKVVVNIIVEGYIADCIDWVERQLKLENNTDDSESFVEIKRIH